METRKYTVHFTNGETVTVEGDEIRAVGDFVEIFSPTACIAIFNKANVTCVLSEGMYERA